MLTDPIGDFITRIRNAGRAGHAETTCPSSKQKLAVAQVLKDAGYIDDVVVEPDESGAKPQIRITLRYTDDGRFIIDGMRRVSRPSCRVYVGAGEIPKVRGGLGVAVMSTNKGVISDAAAREQSVGGEVVCEVW